MTTRSRAAAKIKQAEDDGDSDNNRKKELFKSFRDELTADLPVEYKDKWGQMAWGEFSKVYYPILILSPFHVPPNPLRQQWFEKYKKVCGHVCILCTSAWITLFCTRFLTMGSNIERENVYIMESNVPYLLSTYCLLAQSTIYATAEN